MRLLARLLTLFILSSLVSPTLAQSQKQSAWSQKILSAKSVYFDDRIGVAAVRDRALAQLKKWGQFEIVSDRQQADLILILSADPYKGGQIAISGGQTGKVNKDGSIDADPVPNYNKLAPVRYAYLTAIEPKTGEELWGGRLRWGGLLTGFNSVGARLVKKLEKESKN
ncbi:MAG: hypothetical protein M1453_10620 [Acidobacteria bacterium]|nr:hypothetical protein [Acidobacteriota bacterium]